MRAKKIKQETQKESVKDLFGGETNAVGKMTDAMGQLPGKEFPEINKEQTVIPGTDAVKTERPCGAFEIVPGMTVEEMVAMFFDGALIEDNSIDISKISNLKLGLASQRNTVKLTNDSTFISLLITIGSSVSFITLLYLYNSF